MRGKSGKRWQALVGYSAIDLMEHLERQFTKGMGWDNMGDWHIDHIRPVSFFAFTSENDPGFLECWALANLRPLWKTDNLAKGRKITHLV